MLRVKTGFKKGLVFKSDSHMKFLFDNMTTFITAKLQYYVLCLESIFSRQDIKTVSLATTELVKSGLVLRAPVKEQAR